jgi:hypothetical protein
MSSFVRYGLNPVVGSINIDRPYTSASKPGCVLRSANLNLSGKLASMVKSTD